MKFQKEFKAGIIVVITVLAFWWLFLFLKGKNLFSDEDIYYVKFNNVAGLSKSKNVNINGLKVGSVESIIPVSGKNNKITFVVELKINKNFEFSKNSIAQISSSLMNGSEINLALAETGVTAKSGDTLQSQIIPGIMDIASAELKPLSANANSVLQKLDSTLTATNKILNDKNRMSLESALVNLNQTLTEFKTLGKNSNGLINQNTEKLSTALDNANKMMVTANGTIEKYGTLADKLNQSNFEQTLSKLETTLSNLNEITGKINSGEGSMGKLISDPVMYNNLTDASKNLSLLLEDFKKNPKNYVHFSVFGGGKKKEDIKDVKK